SAPPVAARRAADGESRRPLRCQPREGASRRLRAAGPHRHADRAAMTGADLVSARAAGMVACGDCGTVWRDVAEGAACHRCGARLQSRKPESMSRTWAMLATAAMLYVPANLLPVMTTRTVLGTQEGTILSGIVYFW